MGKRGIYEMVMCICVWGVREKWEVGKKGWSGRETQWTFFTAPLAHLKTHPHTHIQKMRRQLQTWHDPLSYSFPFYPRPPLYPDCSTYAAGTWLVFLSRKVGEDFPPTLSISSYLNNIWWLQDKLWNNTYTGMTQEDKYGIQHLPNCPHQYSLLLTLEKKGNLACSTPAHTHTHTPL